MLVKLTKYGWFESKDDSFVFRSVADEVKQFLQGSLDHYVIGLKLLAELVATMNQVQNIGNSFKKYILTKKYFFVITLFEIKIKPEYVFFIFYIYIDFLYERD